MIKCISYLTQAGNIVSLRRQHFGKASLSITITAAKILAQRPGAAYYTHLMTIQERRHTQTGKVEKEIEM